MSGRVRGYSGNFFAHMTIRTSQSHTHASLKRSLHSLTVNLLRRQFLNRRPQSPIDGCFRTCQAARPTRAAPPRHHPLQAARDGCAPVYAASSRAKTPQTHHPHLYRIHHTQRCHSILHRLHTLVAVSCQKPSSHSASTRHHQTTARNGGSCYSHVEATTRASHTGYW